MNEKSVVRWDKYQTVKDAIQSKQPQARLMVICFAEQWNRTSTHAAHSFERIRMSGDLPFAQIFILDAFSDQEASFDYQIEVTPAVVFLWDGSVLNVQRPNWDDDCKCKFDEHDVISSSSLV